MTTNRRRFIRQIGGLATGFSAISVALASCNDNGNAGVDGADSANKDTTKTATTGAGQLFFEISLAQWSLHRALFEKKIDNLDFPLIAKRDYGFSSVRMQKSWVLNDLFVAEGHRGLGVSKELLKAAQQLAKESKAAGLFLETEKTNSIANKLYPLSGFQLCDTINYYFWANE